MNKQTYDVIRKFGNEVTEVYFRLKEKGFPEDEIEEILGDLNTLDMDMLNLNWSEIDKRMDEIEPTFIKEEYDNIAKFLKLYILRDCEDNMALCISTAQEVYLVPKNLLDNPNAERIEKNKKESM